MLARLHAPRVCSAVSAVTVLKELRASGLVMRGLRGEAWTLAS